MRRVLAAAALVVAGAFGPAATPARADLCAGGVCAVGQCTGTVNVCSSQSCSGGVSVCPLAPPQNCHSTIDVCTGHLTPVTVSCSSIEWVCDIVFPD